jgi:ribosomal protein S18 acetylase RimI-like enzyme
MDVAKTMGKTVKISQVSAAELDQTIASFATILTACVEDGASVGFVMPFSVAESGHYWRMKILPPVREGRLILLAAYVGDQLAGTVQLNCNTMPNQPHRADVSKLLVHPDFRRRGIAKLLMAKLESEAKTRQRSLLTLDTRAGDTAEPLYKSLGFQTVGTIPGFAVDPYSDKLDATTIMYKQLV